MDYDGFGKYFRTEFAVRLWEGTNSKVRSLGVRSQGFVVHAVLTIKIKKLSR